MRLRPFVSLLVTLAFLVMTLTGLMLFVVPKGRIADWSRWEFFGLTKTDYTALHVTFMVLFIVGIFVHIWLNWGPLVHYLKNRSNQWTFATKEFLGALGLTVVFIIGTLWAVPPFSTLLDFEEQVKTSWEKEVNDPPYGHAELSSLEVLAKRTNLDVTLALKALQNSGIQATKETILIDLADRYNTSPDAIFKQMHYSSEPSKEVPASQGLGRMELGALAAREGFDLAQALAYLGTQGVEADATSKLKPLAESLGTTPYDLIERFRQEK